MIEVSISIKTTNQVNPVEHVVVSGVASRNEGNATYDAYNAERLGQNLLRRLACKLGGDPDVGP